MDATASATASASAATAPPGAAAAPKGKKAVAPRAYFTRDDIEAKRQRREAALPGLSDLRPLLERFESAQSRACAECGDAKNNNRIYCYRCIKPVGGVVLPRVALPLKLDIVRHARESRTKSTALHAMVLGEAGAVRIAETPDLGALGAFDAARTVLLYPSRDAVTLAEMGDALRGVERVVVVDSTWQQAAAVLRSPELRGLRHVKLGASYNTSFWRYQRKGDEFLATIEAIHYFFREYAEATQPLVAYDGRFDDLLYIFVGMLRVIEAKKAADADAE